MNTHTRRWIGIPTCLLISLVGCPGDEPSADTNPTTETGDVGDGDGDTGDGDGDSGDGDGDSGDGDGDSGDGDGDGDSGDGDGDPCSNPDQDQDGHDAQACGGMDCNDSDPTINPDAPDFTIEPEVVVLGLSLGIGQSPLDISLDAQNIVHIGYTLNQDLFHAFQVANAWQVVPLSTGRDPTILSRQNGVVEAVSTQELGFQITRHQRFNGLVMETMPIPNVEAHLNAGHAFVLSSTDVPHIATRDTTNNALRYSTRPDVDWMPTVVDPQGGSYAAVALGPMEEPHIFYVATGAWKLRHAKREPDNTWTITDVGNVNTEIVPSLAVDANGHAWAAWPNGNLTVATNESGSWTVDVVPNIGLTWANDTVIGPDGTVYIAFEAFDPQGIMSSISLIHNRDGDWTARELMPTNHKAVSLAIDEGWIHVTLADVTAGQVLYFKLPVADGIDQDCDGDEW